MAATRSPSSRRSRGTRGLSGKASGADLPVGAGSFLGRAEQVSELIELLGRARLVTLTGTPGIGKSRLALELAGRLAGQLAGGAHVVELAPVARARDVPRAVACALSIHEVTGQRVTDTLLARLDGRRLALVLDNCEHLIPACAKLVERMLSKCPEVTVLATSREPLGLDGEHVWQVPALAAPDRGEDVAPGVLGDYAAVALFVERAKAVQPGLVLNAYVAPAVAEICRRLDGIPLAIELAAARVESLTPEEIARHLDDRLDLLRRARPGKPARHQTLKAALDWSYELLSEPERTLLRRMAVFISGFELEAAEAVCSGGEVEPGEVADLLGRLVAKSLVVAAAGGSSPPPRYRLLETIRAYAADRLDEADERAELRIAHARFHLTLVEEAEPELTGPEQQEWLERLEAERPNLRSAIEWSLSQGEPEQALRLAGALVLFWRVRCHFSEGRELLEAAVSAADGAPAGLQAKALWGAGFMALMAAGDVDRAIPVLTQSLSHFRELDDSRGCARALLILGNCKQLRGDPSVLSLFEESAALARGAGDAWCLAHAVGVAGFEHAAHYELAAARSLFEECLAVARAARDTQGLRIGLIGLGMVCVRQGDFALAEPLLEEASELTGALSEHYGRALALQHLGYLAVAQGDHGRAGELLNEAVTLMRDVSHDLALPDLLAGLGSVAHAKGDHRGARLFFEDALAVARAYDSRSVTALQGMGRLAVEEDDLDAARSLFREALELARAGADNAGVANALHSLGDLARVSGEGGRDAALHYEALELRHRAGASPEIAASLEAIAGLDPAAGGYEHSARLFGAAGALREAKGYARAPWDFSRYESDVALVRGALGAEGFETAFSEGGGLSIDQAMTEACKRRGRRGRPAGGWSSLTRAEQEVAALAAEGLTNAAIADRLLVSHWTVKFHLSHVFAKLGVAGRTELAREVGRRLERRLGSDR